MKVEDHVRLWHGAQHGVMFEKRFLTLSPGGRHEFDAVSDDGLLVASIKSNSGLTRTGKVPDGKIKNAFTEVYSVSRRSCWRRLVLTSPGYYKIFSRASAGKLAQRVTLLLAELPPPALQAEVDTIQEAASLAVIPGEAFPVLNADERDLRDRASVNRVSAATRKIKNGEAQKTGRR